MYVFPLSKIVPESGSESHNVHNKVDFPIPLA
jgi:hypothetical protein